MFIRVSTDGFSIEFQRTAAETQHRLSDYTTRSDPRVALYKSYFGTEGRFSEQPGYWTRIDSIERDNAEAIRFSRLAADRTNGRERRKTSRAALRPTTEAGRD